MKIKSVFCHLNLKILTFFATNPSIGWDYGKEIRVKVPDWNSNRANASNPFIRIALIKKAARLNETVQPSLSLFRNS